MTRLIPVLILFLLIVASPVNARDDETLVDTWSEPTLSGVTTDGRFVVWSKQYGGASQGTDVYAHDLTSGETRHAASPRAGLWAFDDGVVAWAFTAGYHNLAPESFGVFALDLVTGETYMVSDESNAVSVYLSERKVIWAVEEPSEDGSERVYKARNLDNTAEPTVIPQLNPEFEQLSVQHAGNRFYWVERDPASTDRNIVYWVPGDTPRILIEGGNITYLRAFPESVMFTRSGHLYMTGNASREYFEIQPGWDIAPSQVSFDGRYLFWQTEDPEYRVQHIMAYDLLTTSTFTVVALELPEDEMFGGGLRMGGADGGIITWGIIDYSSPMASEVHATDITNLLPTAPRPPGHEDAKQTYYPETGHYLGWGFRDYSTANGGLPVFGYPLTEEFQQVSDTGLFHNVQYFERQRFEWHPENAGTPYEVLLGRLGAEQARQLGLLETESFVAREEHDSNGDGCAYFAPTGHFVCDAFLAYWQDHGLEFGDAGVTYQESLALFGFPLSEPFTTTNVDGDTVLTQYFERAVFEHHPQNEKLFNVLLRRLGVEVLTAQDW